MWELMMKINCKSLTVRPEMDDITLLRRCNVLEELVEVIR